MLNLFSKKKIEQITILEKDEKIGGLLRSYKINKIFYDVGPHIIFSKNKKILNIILNILGKNKNALKRSNKIIYNKNTLLNIHLKMNYINFQKRFTICIK